MEKDEMIENIKHNGKIFEEILSEIKNCEELDKKQKLAKIAIDIAAHRSTGYFSSPIIENVFLEIASKNSLKKKSFEYKKNTFLHIMSETFETGGHTRVVERWIELGEKKQKHSLLLTTKEQQKVPKRLTEALTQKQGDLIKLPDSFTDIEKGLKLREIASQYEFIIMHIHQFDIVPLIAFGTFEFKRPVIFFNHADHKFWVGVSVSDMIVNFRTWGEDICLEKRGVVNNFTLSLPIDEKNFMIDMPMNDLRKKLNLPIDKKIIVTVGAYHKYKAISKSIDFLNIVKKILLTHEDVIIVVIGPKYSYLHNWKKVSKAFNSRFLALGEKSPDDMFEYLRASDLVLDSFPMSGGTALMDAVTCKKPILSLKCPTGQLDYVINSVAYCLNEEELLKKTALLLFNKSAAELNIKDVWSKLNEETGKENWINRTNNLYKQMKNMTHKVYDFEQIKVKKIDDLDVYLDSENRRINRKMHIPYFFSLFTIKENGTKHREIKLFNKYKIKLKAK